MTDTNTQNQTKSGNVSKLIGDIVVAWKNGKFKSAKHVSIVGEKAKDYLINGEKISDVQFVSDHSIIVFYTASSLYFRDEKFGQILGSDGWVDFYIDPFTSSFYRKDARNFWYDIEGARTMSSFILKDDVLTSLNGKISLKNGMFKNQKPYASVSSKLVQIGKVLLDSMLKPVLFHNERITGLGASAVYFENGTVYQEVKLGIKASVFLNEDNKEPVIVDGEALDSFVSTVEMGESKFHVFNSGQKEIYLDASDENHLSLDAQGFTIDPDSYLKIGEHEVVSIRTKNERYYYDLKNEKPFVVKVLGDSPIHKASRSNIAINNEDLINVATKKKAIVITSNDLSQFSAQGISQDIEKVKNVPGFEGVFAMVTIDGKQQLFSLIDEKIVEIDNLNVVAVNGHSRNKLLNAVTSDGERTVIDLRNGFSELAIANSDGDKIVQTIGQPYKIGSKVLQNVKLETLGGNQEGVINLNSPQLSRFTFPQSLVSYTDGELKSVFAGISILNINFENVLEIEGKQFLKAQFRSYDDALQTVILDKDNGRPLQMDGLGHKLELITEFSDYSLETIYKLGPHRMIGVTTLKEDLKKDELLFSLKAMNSWLPFSESYLPIFKRIVEVDDVSAWEYHLFELRELSKDKEYIAVEQSAPYRILVKKKGNKQIPIVVKSKEKVLKSPEEISMVRKLFFEDPGVLVEIY